MDETLARIPGLRTARVAGVGRDGMPLIRWDGEGVRPRAARALWRADGPDWSACRNLRVLIGFEDGDEQRPIVLGLLDPPPAAPAPAASAAANDASAAATRPKILRLESDEEIVLECGSASIRLRGDGRITLRGTHLLSRSSGPNKIKGASIELN